MKLLTRDTDYAVRALSELVKNKDRVVSVSELVKELNAPRPFLRKILQLLNKKGMLKSFKGRGGGFILAVPSQEIYLADLIKIFQGPIKLNGCLFKKRICPDITSCMLKRRIDKIQQQVISELKSITIESLIR